MQCLYYDPHCPCQDGDQCHYETYGNSKGMDPRLVLLARIAELTAECEGLKATLARTQSAAKSGMDAATEVGRWQMEEARRLKAECSPVSIASQREANERLTNELEIEKQAREAAEACVVKLREAVEKSPHHESCGFWVGMFKQHCNCWKSAALADTEE